MVDVGGDAGDWVGGWFQEPLQLDSVEYGDQEAHLLVDLGLAEGGHLTGGDGFSKVRPECDDVLGVASWMNSRAGWIGLDASAAMVRNSSSSPRLCRWNSMTSGKRRK